LQPHVPNMMFPPVKPPPVMPLSEPDRRNISLAHLSLIESEPSRFLQIASQAGFDHVDLRLSPAIPTDRAYTTAQRAALCRELWPILRDTGLRVWDVEIIRIHAKTRADEHLPLMEAAAVLGARRLKVVCDCHEQPQIVATVVGLCELAAPLRLNVDLEYMVFSGVKSLRAALDIVHAAQQPNLQVLVDALHWMRAGDTPAGIAAAPPGDLGYLQLCDGPLEAPVGRELLIREARTNRLPPGEGQFPLDALLHAMPSQCAVSLEVPLPPGHDALAHASHLLAAARALLERHEDVA
jgi:sugar phosphate isomerase/epimerase